MKDYFGIKTHLFDFCRSLMIIPFYYVLSLNDFVCNSIFACDNIINIVDIVSQVAVDKTVLFLDKGDGQMCLEA